MSVTKAQQKNLFTTLKETLGFKNPMQTPRIEKLVVSVGIGSVKDKNRKAMILDRLTRITGQKPALRAAKKSIATFKLRQGDIVGYQVTLRGDRMHDFLDKLIHVALPRTRDFRGIPRTAIDGMGNITIGIKEHTIFPETSDEELKDVFGFAVTIVSSAKNKVEAEALLEAFGFPLQKNG
jgi:large subunit ribosomal protein L5